MSFNAMSWAAHQVVPDCESKLLLLMLAEHASSHDSEPPIYTCWPGKGRLCRECLLSENTINSRLKVLAELGLITIQERKDDEGRNRSNLYTLMMSDNPWRSPRSGEGSSRGGVGVTGRPGEGSPHDPEPVIGTDVHKLKKSKGSLEEVVAYCLGENLTSNDGEWFFNKCEGNGWKNAREPIRDWKATIRAWKAAGYMPSQKTGQRQSNKETATQAVQRILKGIQ